MTFIHMLITNKLHLKIFINGHELHEVFLIYANDHQCSTYKYYYDPVRRS